MTKSSTITNFIEKKEEVTEEKTLNENLNSEYADIIDHLELNQLEPSQKSVDFILNFSKAYRAKKMSNGNHTEMIIN
jgi:hypothetical protein